MTTGRINQVAAFFAFGENFGYYFFTKAEELLTVKNNRSSRGLRPLGWISHTRGVGSFFRFEAHSSTRKDKAQNKRPLSEEGLFCVDFSCAVIRTKRILSNSNLERCYTFAIVRYHAAAPAPGPPSSAEDSL